MNYLVNVNNKYVVILRVAYGNIGERQILGLIDFEEGLLNYVLDIMQMYELSSNNGYLKFENKEGEVYLHRIIMEYYAKYDTKLFTVFSSGFEVNHKNFCKCDNRLKNLEMVTRLGNEKHKRNMDYRDEVAISSEELMEIQRARLTKRKHYNDKKKLQEYENGHHFMYRRFNNVNAIPHIELAKDSDDNTLKWIVSKNLSDYFSHVCANVEICAPYDVSRARKIIRDNTKMILKYYCNNNIFREFCIKYNILDKFSWLFMILFSKPIPFNFYYMYKNQLCFVFSINSLFSDRGKYNSFRAMYYIGLLGRTNHIKMYNKFGKLRSSSQIAVPTYTDRLFKTVILKNIKKLKKNNYPRFTSTIVMSNDGFKVAKNVYQDERLLSRAEKNQRSIKDIENILISDTIYDRMKRYGFVKVYDIREEWSFINDARRAVGLEARRIDGKADKFIKTILENVLEVKDVMKEHRMCYVIVNKKTKEKIQLYQKKNGIEDTDGICFHRNERAVVLRKLYVSTKSRKRKKRRKKKASTKRKVEKK